MNALPRLAVPRQTAGPLTADAGAEFWRGVAPVALCDAVTGRAPKQATELRVASTEQALRVLFTAADSLPWATLEKRDDPLYTEEVVEVFLDPVGDLGAYFEIEVNPLGAVLDLLIRRNVRGLLKDFRWQCDGLQTLVARTSDGWAAELVIPWAGLSQERPAPGEMWRGNFTRIDRPKNEPRELSAWSQTGQELFHVPERFGLVEFL